MLVAATIGAWTLIVGRMAGMDAGAGADLGGLGWFVVSWMVMMAAMMLPELAPMLAGYGRRAGRADSDCDPDPTFHRSGISFALGCREIMRAVG